MLEEELRSHELEILRFLSNIQNVEEERDSLITRVIHFYAPSMVDEIIFLANKLRCFSLQSQNMLYQCGVRKQLSQRVFETF